MGKSLLTLVVLCLLGVCTAMAQASGSTANQNPQQQPNDNPSTTTTSPPAMPATPNADTSAQPSSTMPNSTQSAMSNGATQMSNGGNQTVEGCLVKEQTAYYVQPVNGGARVQLTPSRSLDSYAGQHVQVTGHTGAAEGDNATATATGGASDTGGMLTVTGVKTISATCSPASVPSQR